MKMKVPGVNVLEWIQSLDVLVSVLLECVGNTEFMYDDWELCVRLLENLSLDVMAQAQCLLEDRTVCVHLLGSLWAEDLSAWAFLNL